MSRENLIIRALTLVALAAVFVAAGQLLADDPDPSVLPPSSRFWV